MNTENLQGMDIILNIETSTNICSVGLSRNGECIKLIETSEEKAHASNITLLIEKIFAETGYSIRQLSAVAVSSGPGSYTGLRIGASVAKGIAYSIDLPLIAVDTLKSLACGAVALAPNPDAFYCPMIDARRWEAYLAIYDFHLNPILTTQAHILTENSLDTYLTANTEVYCMGNGSEKFKEKMAAKNWQFLSINCSANYIGILSYESYQKSEFVSVAYFEPFYLKEANVTTPKNKIGA